MNKVLSKRHNGWFRLFLAGVSLLFYLSTPQAVRGQDTGTQDRAVADTVVSPDSLNDGPHVFLGDDSAAVVFYLCRDDFVKETRYGRDTVRFEGRCDDRGTVYAAARFYSRDTVCRFENVSRIFTVSDIHGEYGYFRDILLKAGIVDSSLHWAWGDGHLVVLGDIFDRGSRVTECLWLVYRLQQEAPADGGRVHFVLGNHELMVMEGDNRYVNERYLDGIVKKTRIKYEDLYGPDMALGRWLRAQPAVITINGLLFVHGGLNPDMVDRRSSLGHINATVADGLNMGSGRLAFEDEIKYMFGSLGPFWYRGYHYAVEDRYDRAETDEIDRLLNFYGVDKIVVGHSEHDRLEFLYDRRVVAVDVPVEDLGGFQGLFCDGTGLYRVQPDGSRERLE